MKKFLLITTVVVLTAVQMVAAPVDASRAQATAQQFAVKMAGKGGRKAPVKPGDIKLVLAQTSKAIINQPVYYVFNTSDSYVIVSGDDRAREVLAWGDSPLDVNNIPCNMQLWLEGYQEQIEYLQAHPDMVIARAPGSDIPSPQVASVEPLLTALWDQGYPYNIHCPEHNGNKCVTGCPATSLSMVFYYWKYPTEPCPRVYGYRTASLGLQLETLEPMTFDWNNMLDQYRGNFNTEQAEAVAWLMRYVGQDEHMDYAPDGSGSYGQNIVQTVRRFGYDEDVRLLYKEWWNGEEIYSDEEWAAIIQEELEMGRPIVMCAYTATMSGHAFNIDGYDASNDTYHINWGWSGSGNAYCVLNAFNGSGMTFNVSQQLIVGIEPPATTPTIKAWSSRVHTTAYVDSTDNGSFMVKGALLTGDVTVTLHDDNGVFSIDTERIGASQLINGRRVNVSYRATAPGHHTATVILSSEGAQDKVIGLYGTCLLETYNPVMLDASDVNDDSFNVQWQDVTPRHNVLSYNLEVARVPFFELRLSETFDKTEYSGTSTSDWSSRLDEITSTPGWTGSKIYRSNNDLMLGSAKAKGWIETPALDMYGNNGLVTVKVRATCTSSETSAPLKISCEGRDTTITVDNSDTEHTVLLPCPSGDESRVKLSSFAGKRVILKAFNAYAGDDYSPVDLADAIYMEGITSMSHLVSNINSGWYGLRVQALYTDGTLSPWSNRTRVLVAWKRGDVNHDGEINIADVNAIISYITHGVKSSSALAISDVNGDSELNIADINDIIRTMLGR
jgi:hypothetical protein